MAPDGSLTTPKTKGIVVVGGGGGGGLSSSSSSRQMMKKRPWTAAEDAVLMEYVKKHGEGNWNAVQRNSGLMRCGKSCRLRWANHLRPNLKKGAFSSEEENLIVQLHAKLGNKWARMASQLPGRTDNEIKNYWNTRLKRRQRAGLPIYPLEIKPKNHHQEIFQINNITTSFSSLISLLSNTSPAQKSDHQYITPTSIFDLFNSSRRPAMHPPPQPQGLLTSFFSKNNSGLTLSLSSSVNSPFSPTPSSSASFAFNSQGLSQSLPMHSLQFSGIDFGLHSRPFSGSSFESHDDMGSGSGSGSGTELPSIQVLVQAKTSTTTGSSGNEDYVIAISSSAVDDSDLGEITRMEGFSQNGGGCNSNSGLLEDLLGESQALKRPRKAKDSTISVDDDDDDDDQQDDKTPKNFLWDYKLTEDEGICSEELDYAHDQDSSAVHSSIHRAKRMKSLPEEGNMNPVDDDFSSLLDNFPLAVPVTEWYDENGNSNTKVVSNGQSSDSTGINGPEKENQPEYSYSPVPTSSLDHSNNWAMGATSWKNLPGIH